MSPRPRLLDLFSGAGGCSVGYQRAGFDVTGVDCNPKLARHYRGGTFVCADALVYVAEHGHEFDAIHASPPCQAHSTLRSLQPDREYPDLIPATRAALRLAGKPYVIENVPGAPLGGVDVWLSMLCGTMFGLVTPDGRAEIRRHRLFECGGWWPGPTPECQHGGTSLIVAGHSPRMDNAAERLRRKAITVVGHTPVDNTRRRTLSVHGDSARDKGVRHARRRAISVTGNTAQTNTVRNTARETFSMDDARAAMGIDWMPGKPLVQAIPPAYAEWLGSRWILALGR